LTSPANSTVNCPLVFACDEGYAMPLATTLRSIAEANRRSWPLDIYVLSHGFSEHMKRRIIDSLPNGSSSIRWLPVDLTPFAGFSTLRHISSMTYARLLIPSILPVGVTRALYLDTDILVLDDLGPIWDLDLEGAVLGAVLDERLDTYVKKDNTSLAGPPLPRVRDYFNAGVLLIDVAKWRAKRIPEIALEYLEQCPHSVYMDQDALNAACDGLWKKLNPRWNYYQIDLEKCLSDLNAADRPGILHFHGCLKPWDPSSLNLNARFYDRFRTRTLFARTPAEKLKEVPIVIWSRFKRLLKRSVTVRHAWNHLRSLQSGDAPDSGRRLSPNGLPDAQGK
jgi:lipopolysaccharide biosynthesis glycosyltransferase